MRKHKATTVVPHRRRREQKTDYRLRLRMLKSRKNRFVVRYSNNNMICQVVQYKPTGDVTVVAGDSKELKKMGYTGHCGNIPAAYLTGLLCASRAKKKGVSDCIFDIGLYATTKGSKLYAALKGALDAGLNIPHSEDILPSEERISGKHISDYSSALKKDNPDKHKRIFSKSKPEDLSAGFEKAKGKILSAPAEKPKPKPKAEKPAKPKKAAKPKAEKKGASNPPI